MEFTLYYRGALKGNGDPRAKHDLRKIVHQQLKILWEQFPLLEVRSDLLSPNPRPGEVSLLVSRGGFNFAPLVSEKFRVFAELKITLLRPGPPGSILAPGGDIDNRLKTLFDALKVPEPGALPAGASPAPDEDPFFCLMEDDKLIHAVSVSTDQLLDSAATRADVVLLIYVKTRVAGMTWGNAIFA